jgi:nitroreductase
MNENSNKSIIDNTFLRLVKARRSVRKFADRLVERDKIITCIEAARLAPSAENVQPWRFIVMDKEEIIDNFSKEAFSGIYRYTRWASRAPVLIAIAAQLDWLAHRLGKEIQGTKYYLIDIGIAGEHLVLQALELGLGTCWIGWFQARKARKVLQIPRSWKVVALLAMGYPREKKRESKKKIKELKGLEEILFFNGYKKES